MPKISTKAPKKSAARGIATAGGMTSLSLSLGWSWWMPWMMKCMRRPKSLSGSQWKTSLCSQYSVSVQMPMPPRLSRASCQTALPPSSPSHSIATTTGTKTTAGIAGWTREKKLRKSLSKSWGEAERSSVRLWASMHLHGNGAAPRGTTFARRGEVVTELCQRRCALRE